MKNCTEDELNIFLETEHFDTTTMNNYFCFVSKNDNEAFIPTRIIYNPPYTICYFPDGDKRIVKCSADDNFEPDFGVMACIMRKLFDKKANFDRLVESGYWQPSKSKE